MSTYIAKPKYPWNKSCKTITFQNKISNYLQKSTNSRRMQLSRNISNFTNIYPHISFQSKAHTRLRVHKSQSTFDTFAIHKQLSK